MVMAHRWRCRLLVVSLLPLLLLPGCDVERFLQVGRRCTGDDPCGPGTYCDTASATCVADGECPPGLVRCASECIDPKAHPEHASCDDSCVIDISSDHDHCGGCGRRCGTGEICDGGRCWSLQRCSEAIEGADDPYALGSNCGDGSDGDCVFMKSQQLSTAREFNCRTLKVHAGVTLTVAGDHPLIFRVQGPVQLDGAIDVSGSDGGKQAPHDCTPVLEGGVGGEGRAGGGNGGQGATTQDYEKVIDARAGEGPGGGGGGGSDIYCPTGDGNAASGGGGGHYAPGQDGTDGAGPWCSYDCEGGAAGGRGGAAFESNPLALTGGGGGGGGGADVGCEEQQDVPYFCTFGAGGGGGGGGGALAIVACDRIVLTGALVANGGDPAPGSNGSAGGGGGAGGTIVLVGLEVAIDGQTEARGGGQGAGAGGAGRAFVRSCSIPR